MSGAAQQYMVFVKTKSVGQFNVLITAINLAACMLKIGFYFIQPYSDMLLLQTVILIVLMVQIPLILDPPMSQICTAETQAYL